MKKYTIMLLGLLLCWSVAATTASAERNYIVVEVGGDEVEFGQPPIIKDGRTLIPIRAVVEKIGATLEWDNPTRTMTISKDNTTIRLQVDNPLMQVSGAPPVQLDVAPQIIGGSTLMPIRAVVESFGYEVLWNPAELHLAIEEQGVILVDGLELTQRYYPDNWAQISSVQQFSYKDEGLAYAYVAGNKLNVTTPGNTLTLDMKYPLLGDIISDDAGQLYVVWGQENETNNAAMETIFISKYSADGQHIQTTGFVGKSSPWRDADSAKTKVPFEAGNSVSVIANGKLINYHAKRRYDGHQSDNAIAVNISDMSAYPLPKDTFSGHSFNQSVIYSQKASDFLYASHGDAYARGFRVNNSNGSYGDESELLFHFYLEPNANYDMFIVNKTFAQLGGLAETSKGVVLVGASAKSISEDAKKEKQNLFIQLFDPNIKQISSSKFIGGQTRSGALSTDINDNSNAPLTPVTNYGVHWLTGYTDRDVVAPQVVTADDRIVILWSTMDESFYTVLSNDGSIVTPTTSLGRLRLNSYEPPVYHDGAVHWASVDNGRLKVSSIEL